MKLNWRPIIGALAPRLLLIVGVSAGFWKIFGASWGWLSMVVGLALVLIIQTRQLIAFSTWLQFPDETEYPDAGGIWGEVFMRLSRRLRADEKKRLAIEEELLWFRDAIQALPEGILFLDANHQIRWGNHAAAAHLSLGFPVDLGAVLTQLVRAPGFDEYLTRMDPDGVFLLQSKGQRARIYSLTAMPFRDQNKILVSVDVTEAKRVEAMRSDFVANVSHELRTPLTVVNGFLEHFSDDAPMSVDERQHFCHLMEAQTNRMLSLVDDLLTLSRLESKDAPTVEGAIDMKILMEQLLEEAKSLSKENHQITCRYDLLGLRGNLKEIHSAFGNLVINAVRYTPVGGKIALEWSVREGVSTFSVRDSGPGIDAQHHSRLTERFYRADRGRSRDTGGTGLGLAIVKHVLLRHQATLEIKSALGEGSTFSAHFPAWRTLKS